MSFDASWLAWTGVILLIVVGIAGTVLPALPGTVLVLAGIVWGAWLDEFTRVPVWVVVVCVGAGRAGLGHRLRRGDDGRQARARQRLGAGGRGSRHGGRHLHRLHRSAVHATGRCDGGRVVGPARQHRRLSLAGDHAADGKRALEVGFATWLGIMIGTAVKLALTFVMVGLFAFTYFF